MNPGAAGATALTCTEWRGWSSQHIAPLLQSEAERWARDFFWDQRWSFTNVEAARESGRLPGIVVTDAAGATRGWTFFLRHGDQFQVGTVVSDSEDATRALVDAALASPLAEAADVVVFSPAAPGLSEALQAHAIRTEPYDYLVLADAPAAFDARRAPDGVVCRALVGSDLGAVAALVGEAYRHTTFLRPFVPGGDPDDWRDYVGQLVDTRGCGEFLADASVVIDGDADPESLRGALLATRLSSDTGHIAQVMVSAHARGGGLARRMLERSLSALHGHGLRRVSLLVARTNIPARTLYLAMGFQPAGTFLTGIR